MRAIALVRYTRGPGEVHQGQSDPKMTQVRTAGTGAEDRPRFAIPPRPDMLCCDWVKAMDVQMYMRVSDKINATLGDKELSMPEKTIMDYDFAACRSHQ